MAPLERHQYPYNDDNYGVLLHCPESGDTVAIDSGDADATNAALAATGWHLTQIWVTHHHGDHTAGVAALKARHHAQVVGPTKTPLAAIDHRVDDGDHFTFAGRPIRAIATPGHTLDMMNFHLPDEGLVFTGDTLFALGCGRLFEGDATIMWPSLEKLLALPDDTMIYCSHEYTQANARFAVSVDPDNDALKDRAAEIDRLRAMGIATVPTTLALEKATNPFLRPDDPAIRAHLGMQDADNVAVFAEIRARKDRF